MSALSSRYIPIVLFPYYIALASQWIASVYSAFAVPETLSNDSQNDEDDGEEDISDDNDENSDDNEGLVEAIVDDIIEPIKPLRLLLPRREDGVLHWRLFIVTLSLLATTSGVSMSHNLHAYCSYIQTVFIVTASLLLLSDKFSFNPEGNAWVLAYIAFTKALYLVLLFPFIQNKGRTLFRRLEAKKSNGAGGNGGERMPLIRRKTGDRAVDEGNHFDVSGILYNYQFKLLFLILDDCLLINRPFWSFYQYVSTPSHSSSSLSLRRLKLL